MQKFFIDSGNYPENGDPSEVYIRKEMNGEIFDICNFSPDETNFPLDNANVICHALNTRDQLIQSLKDLTPDYEHSEELENLETKTQPELIELLIAAAKYWREQAED